MIFSKDTEWLKPFIETVKKRKLVPIGKLKAIKGYKVALSKLEDGYGQTTIYNDGRAIITLRTRNQYMNKLRRKKEYKNTRYEMLLQTLAHEIAHLKYWEHDLNHFKLQTQIMLLFVPIMAKLGISDHSRRIRI